MYHFFVRRRIRKIFAHLNRGDVAYVQRQFATTAEHWFSGHHSLSGKRTTIRGRSDWYERLKIVFPTLRFAVHKIVVTGWPWRTDIAVEWSDRVFDSDGAELLPNQGVFVMTLRWARATEFHVYCDTQELAKNLKNLAARGVADAAKPPIIDSKSPRDDLSLLLPQC